MEPVARTEPAASRTRRQANRWLALTLAATLFAACVLRTFPPGVSAFYPACPFREWTGLLCPGCGATRAAAALVRGDFREALRSNGLAVIALALCAGWLGAAYVRVIKGHQPIWTRPPLPAIAAAWASALLFTVARNL